MDGHNNTLVSDPSHEGGSDLCRRSAPRLDPDKYADDLKAFDLGEAEGREFLQTLWDILVMCADVELDFDPVSLICGQNEKSGLSAPFEASSVVKSEVNSTSKNPDEKDAP